MRDADVLDQSSVSAAFEGNDVAVHAAALVSIDTSMLERSFDINLLGTRNVIEACKDNQVSRLIHISTVHVFEPLRGINLNKELPTATDSRVPYSLSKAFAHREVLRAMSESQPGGSVICPSGLIGPFDDRPSLVGSMLLDIVKQKIPMLVSEGYWWADVRDVAAATARAVSVESNGNVYFTAGRFATLKQLAGMCSEIVGRDVSPPTVPYFAAVAGLPFVRVYSALRNLSPLYTRESLSAIRDCPDTIDQTDAIEDLDYHPRPLQESIADTISWFNDNGMIP